MRDWPYNTKEWKIIALKKRCKICGRAAPIFYGDVCFRCVRGSR